MLRSVQDRLAAEAARAWLNQRMRRYGRVEALQLDSQARRVSLEVQLEGEPGPISVEIPAYRLEVIEGRPQVTILEASASRPWIGLALAEHVVGRPFPVPAWAATAL